MTPTLDVLVRQLREAMAEVPCNTYLPFRDDNGFIACQNCGQSETTHTLIAAVGAAIEPLLDALTAAHEREDALRRYLWLNHGCRPMLLYGDDGEMQCSNDKAHPGQRFLDFKRDDLPSLVVAAVNGAEAEAARLRAQLNTLNESIREAEDALVAAGRPEGERFKAGVLAILDEAARLREQVQVWKRMFEESKSILASARTHVSALQIGLAEAHKTVGHLDAWAVTLAAECAKLRAERDAAREALRRRALSAKVILDKCSAWPEAFKLAPADIERLQALAETKDV